MTKRKASRDRRSSPKSSARDQPEHPEPRAHQTRDQQLHDAQCSLEPGPIGLSPSTAKPTSRVNLSPPRALSLSARLSLRPSARRARGIGRPHRTARSQPPLCPGRGHTHPFGRCLLAHLPGLRVRWDHYGTWMRGPPEGTRKVVGQPARWTASGLEGVRHAAGVQQEA